MKIFNKAGARFSDAVMILDAPDIKPRGSKRGSSRSKSQMSY